MASDDVPPTKEVTMSVEDFSGVSTLTPVTLPDVDEATGDDEGKHIYIQERNGCKIPRMCEQYYA